MGRRRRGDLPLSAYGIIGDGQTAALVARDGSIDWLCHGRFDGPAVLCRLLDTDHGGYLQVAPATQFAARHHYIGHTNALATQFECATGQMRLTDCMPLEMDSPVILRRLEGLSGAVPVRVEFVPSFDFALSPAAVEVIAGGCQARAGQRSVRLSCPAPMVTTGAGATASFELAAGETRWVALTHGEAPPDDDAAEWALESTLKAWEEWSGRGNYPAPYAEILRRSALVLKLLIHSPTGAMVAAPTTSLPEAPGGVRNWDYRFTWLRDSSWIVSALMDLGYHDESMAFINWLGTLDLAKERPPALYGLDGEPPADEQELHHLRGYRAARPVRVGNATADQDQHDVFGEVVSAIHLCSERMPSMRPLDMDLWNLVCVLAGKAAAHWRHADHGLWEVRDRPRHFLSSKLLCWMALDAALAIASRDRLPGPIGAWEGERNQIRAAILNAGFSDKLRAFARAFGESELDATALLLPRSGLLPARDPRMIDTVDAVQIALSMGPGLLRRYAAPDGLPGTDGAFAACSFWLVDCLVRQGRVEEARGVFEQVVAHASELGLLSEEINPDSGELLGNYPQAFTHLALIRAGVAVSEAEGSGSNQRARTVI